MQYSSIIQHPQNGQMLNKTESAKYLGISRKKFQRIAPAPDYVQEDVYPFWSRRVLDLLVTDEGFDCEEVRMRGKACGSYLIGGMDGENIEDLRQDLKRIHTDGRSHKDKEETQQLLRQYGITMTFRSCLEASQFVNGIGCAINGHERHRKRDQRRDQ